MIDDGATSPSGSIVRALPWREPADLFAAVGDWPGVVFLDGAASGDPRSGFSYIGLFPTVEVRLQVASLDEVEAALRRLKADRPPVEIPLPFVGGMIGMIGYAPGARHLTRLRPRDDDAAVPDLVVRRYGLILGFDLDARRMWAMGDSALLERALAAEARETGAPEGAAWREESGAADHRAAVEKVLAYIAAGDIYQANVTTRFAAERPAGLSPAAAYRQLRRRSPAPFGGFIDLGEGSALISASPERFVQCDRDGRIETRPIKGTMPRDPDPARDRANAEALAASEKDIAENLMICDLLRNDLSKVAVAGSIAVPQLAALEGFASVWHLVSEVRGQLAPGRDAIDLLCATLPGGSITGAPKKRAIEIIDEVEASARGAFYGTLFWLGDDGAMDSSIIIRSVVATPTRLIAAAGGGIVADSDPAAEYAELRTKIDPILEAFGPKP